jgi:hypothetical protein
MTTPPAAKRLASITHDLEVAKNAAVADSRIQGTSTYQMDIKAVGLALTRLHALIDDMIAGVEESPPVIDMISPPKLFEILQAVTESFGVAECELKSPSRARRFTYPRHAFIWIARRVYPAIGEKPNGLRSARSQNEKSWSQFANAIGRADHTTAIHSFFASEKLMQEDAEYAFLVRRAMQKLSIPMGGNSEGVASDKPN